MARYGSADTGITLNSQVISADVTEVGDIPKEAIIEEITGMGDDWERHHAVGVFRGGTITLAGPYRDDANSLSDVAEDVGVGGTATLVVAYGGSKSTTWDVIIVNHNRPIARGALTRSSVTVQTTGEPTEA